MNMQSKVAVVALIVASLMLIGTSASQPSCGGPQESATVTKPTVLPALSYDMPGFDGQALASDMTDVKVQTQALSDRLLRLERKLQR